MPPPLLNIKNFLRLDGMQNLVLPNELYVNCYGYVKTPLLTDSSNKIATTEWVKQSALSLNGFTTTNLAEGNNLYWTDARFDTRFGYKSTSDVQEGINLYFTNTRARVAISLTTIGTAGAATYNNITGVLNIPAYIGGVTSVNTKTGAVVLTTTDVAEETNLYYTDARARLAISLTTIGSNGVATYAGGVFNIPSYTLSGLGGEPAITAGTSSQYFRGDKSWQTLPIYTLSGLGGVPTSRIITINGSALDLSADRSWTIDSMVYPSAGIALSTGTGWGTSVINNSSNWNTAYGWGNHALVGYLTSYTETDPIFLASVAYGITNLQISNWNTSYGWGNHSLVGYENTSNKSTNVALGTSNTLYPTQLAVKTYVDSVMTGGMLIQGDWNASTNSPDLSGSITTGYTWRVSVAGSTNLGGITAWNINDLAVKTASGWIKIDNSSTVQSVFGRQGVVVATTGDYTTAQVTESGNLYFTTTRARASFSAGANITITDGVIANTYSYSLPIATDTILGGVKIGGGITISLGVISVSTNYEAPIASGTTSQYFRGDKSWQTLPIYTLSGLGGVPTSRSLTINGVVYDLSLDRSWTIAPMIYPGAGIALSTGSAWATSITDNSTNWNTAYTDRLKWDGGATGLVAATGRTSLGLGSAAIANTGDFAAVSHTHTISNVINLQTTLDGKESSITAGTTAQYWRGDKTWQTLPIYTLAGLGGVPTTRTLTINGTAYDLSADRSWSIVAGVSSVTASSPLFSSGGSTPNITIQQATSLQAGYLSAVDWTEFNTKQEQIDGLGFVKVAGTTITYDNSSYYLSSNPSGYITSSYVSWGNVSGRPTLLSQFTNDLGNYGGWITGINSSMITTALGYTPFSGSGTVNYITKFTSGSTLGNSTIYDNGNSVGINTTSPYDYTQFSLDINGGLIVKNVGKTAQFALINANPAGGGNNGFIIITAGGTTSTSFSNFQTYYGASIAAGTLRMQAAGGNVLIGSTTAVTGAGMLQVVGDVNITGSFKINGSTLAAGGISSFNTRTGAITLTSADVTNALGFTPYNNTNPSGYITSAALSGYVPYTGATSNVNLGGYSITAGAFYEASDVRFKNIIETNPIINISGIDVIKFTRVDDDNNVIRYGYSAQQVQSVLPDVVSGKDKLSVNYMDVHTLKIAALEKRISELEAKLNK